MGGGMSMCGVFSIRVNLARQFGPLFQRPNRRWTVMDSACGLLINLGEENWRTSIDLQ